jgi:hypothetical protein
MLRQCLRSTSKMLWSWQEEAPKPMDSSKFSRTKCPLSSFRISNNQSLVQLWRNNGIITQTLKPKPSSIWGSKVLKRTIYSSFIAIVVKLNYRVIPSRLKIRDSNSLKEGLLRGNRLINLYRVLISGMTALQRCFSLTSKAMGMNRRWAASLNSLTHVTTVRTWLTKRWAESGQPRGKRPIIYKTIKLSRKV